MSTRTRGILGNRQGGTLALVAVCLVCLLGMAALAIDLAAGYAWRAEAQKIADSSALAGGSAFLDFADAQAVPFAYDRAYEYALQHTIKGEDVDSAELTIEVILAERKVRVTVRREGLPTWFGRVLGFDDIAVEAIAAAQAVAAGAARCLKPIALPDMWDDVDQDTDSDNVWDTGEEWELGSDPNDRYQRWDGPGDPDGTMATGYGSDHRTDMPGDFGRSIALKASDPQAETNFEPGIFFPWRLPIDPNMEDCDQGGGGANDQGGATFRKNLCSCNTSRIELGQPYDVEPGNMIGPTYQGIDELIDEDPDVYWEPTNGPNGGPARPDPNSPTGWTDVGTGTPRVVKIALFDPSQITASGMQSIVFNNFALMFLEDQANPQAPVVARFMYYATGEDGPGEGSLVRYLRLVE
jgi:hypothetical protein